MLPRSSSPPPPPSLLRAAALAAAVLLVLPAADAAAQDTACQRLSEQPRLRRWAEAVRAADAPLDLTEARWFTPTGDDPLEQLATRPRYIVAVDLPADAALVDVTCALARLLGLGREDTLIVASRVGLHAVSPRLDYHLIRPLARSHNPRLRRAPRQATADFASELEDALGRQRRERNLLGGAGLASLVLAGLGLGLLLRAPRA